MQPISPEHTQTLVPCIRCNRVFGCARCFDCHTASGKWASQPQCSLGGASKPLLYRAGTFIARFCLEVPCEGCRPCQAFYRENLIAVKWSNLCRSLALFTYRLVPARKFLINAMLPLVAQGHAVDKIVKLVQPMLGPFLPPLGIDELKTSVETRFRRSQTARFLCKGGPLEYRCYRSAQWFCTSCRTAMCLRHKTSNRCPTCEGHLLLISVKEKLMCLTCCQIFVTLDEATHHIRSHTKF